MTTPPWNKAAHPSCAWPASSAGATRAWRCWASCAAAATTPSSPTARTSPCPCPCCSRPSRRRPGHVTIGHRLSAGKKRPFFTLLRAHRQIDTTFVYARTQRDFAEADLGIPAHQLSLIPFHADHRFYRPLRAAIVRDTQICSAGLEWRDYPTLIDAVAPLGGLSVKLAAASPWSKHTNETVARTLPAHVDARRYEYRELRDLYAQSAFVVVPLYENDFQAGVSPPCWRRWRWARLSSPPARPGRPT